MRWDEKVGWWGKKTDGGIDVEGKGWAKNQLACLRAEGKDVCLHVSYQVVCNLPVGMSVEQKKLNVMVQFLLGKPLCFWTELFYPPFLLCISRANGNMFLFKPLTVSCWVPLSRWAVQSCSAASVNNCFDLHPWSWLPVSPCWVSGASCYLSLLAMM